MLLSLEVTENVHIETYEEEEDLNQNDNPHGKCSSQTAKSEIYCSQTIMPTFNLSLNGVFFLWNMQLC